MSISVISPPCSTRSVLALSRSPGETGAPSCVCCSEASCAGDSSALRPAAAQARHQIRASSSTVMRRYCFKAFSSCKMWDSRLFLPVYVRSVRKMTHGQTRVCVVSYGKASAYAAA